MSNRSGVNAFLNASAEHIGRSSEDCYYIRRSANHRGSRGCIPVYNTRHRDIITPRAGACSIACPASASFCSHILYSRRLLMPSCHYVRVGRNPFTASACFFRSPPFGGFGAAVQTTSRPRYIIPWSRPESRHICRQHAPVGTLHAVRVIYSCDSASESGARCFARAGSAVWLRDIRAFTIVYTNTGYRKLCR